MTSARNKTQRSDDESPPQGRDHACRAGFSRSNGPVSTCNPEEVCAPSNPPLHDARITAARLIELSREAHQAQQSEQQRRLASVGNLTLGLVHDFNNLLTVIMGNAETLFDALAAQPALQALADLVIDSAQSGADLTRRLLTFAREQPMQIQPVDLAVLIEVLKPVLQRTLGPAITIHCMADEQLELAMVDPAQLENAVLNLCLAARDAMPDGGEIRLSMRNAMLDAAYVARHPDTIAGHYVCITVADNGAGLLSAPVDYGFAPFLTTRDIGTGIGPDLSLLHAMARRTQGHVSIHSEVGRGTAVRIYLPVPRPLAEDRRNETAPTEAAFEAPLNSATSRSCYPPDPRTQAT